METKNLTLRLPLDLHTWLAAVAAAERRSVNQQAIVFLEAAKEAQDG